MATPHGGRPYNQFRFQVEWGPGNIPSAGFQEVSGLAMEVHVAEYRTGTDPNWPMKITGLTKTNDVTFKRGIIGDVDTLFSWIRDVSSGKQFSYKTVTVSLLDDDGVKVVEKWILGNARPMKYTGATFNGKGTDVAMEELVLAAESIDLQLGS